MSLVFAVIGDPGKYKDTEYSFNEKIVKSKTSFSVFQGKKVIFAGISLCENGSNFNDCVNDVKDYVKGKIDGFDEIIVAPNVMGKFKGDLGFYFSYVYLKTLEELQKENPKEVFLDSTHGINYMSLLAKDAIMLAISVYSVLKRTEVKFVVYNSDPYESTKPLEVHETNSVKINPLAGLKYITFLILNKEENRYKPDKICSCNSSLFSHKDVHRLALALDGGLFLYVKQKLEQTNTQTEKGARILDVNNILKALEDEITNVTWDSFKYKGNVKVETAEAHALFKVASIFNFSSLEDLKNLVEKYCDEITKTIVTQEISEIERSKNRIEDDWKEYAKIKESKKEKSEEDEGKKGHFTRRILYAHGGLPYDQILLKKENDKILIRYKDLTEIEKQID
ncbi:CRISPR-associated CARF protein Csx1 [Acidianus manzaensis]|uniref:CRISPR-associated protein n=1 Tax=Acidianus manzaensis TaxID=282676 RepID=A0A1W6K348_9CREN|nr:CRISPR-associated CARF protein Csx1 [Acidianus manzaensis]ARM76981.1 CRISPR-associated protein [Acidianus manzaensis]